MGAQPQTWRALAGEYFRAVRRTPELLRRNAFRCRTLQEELHAAALRGGLRKAFGPVGLYALGVGVMVGTGVWSLTGYAAALYAGPAVVVAYAVSAAISLLVAACYAELALEFPVAGGAFTYTLATLGELPAWLVAGSLLMSGVAGVASLARGFSVNLAQLLDQPSDLFAIDVGLTYDGGQPYYLDFMAAGVVLALAAALVAGARESALFVVVTAAAKVALVLAIAAAAYSRADPANAQPFIDGAADAEGGNRQASRYGVMQAAAYVYFAFQGYETVVMAIEEARDPGALPGALLGSVALVAALYLLLAGGLVLAVRVADVPVDQQDDVFVYAFRSVGLPGWRFAVNAAALLGIVTSLAVNLFAAARLAMVCARDWLLPPPLARVSRRFRTPAAATATLAVVSAVAAALVPATVASELSGFSALFAAWAVANVALVRRHWPGVKLRVTTYGTVEASAGGEGDDSDDAGGGGGDAYAKAKGGAGGAAPPPRRRRRLSLRARRGLVWAHLAALNGAALALALMYEFTVGRPSVPDNMGAASWTWVPAAAWLAATASMAGACPVVHEPAGWRLPRAALPWLPSAAVALTVFSMVAMPPGDTGRTYVIIGGWAAALVGFYVLFALPFAYIKRYRLDSERDDALAIVELVFIGGRWRSAYSLGAEAPLPAAAAAAAAAGSSYDGGAGGAPGNGAAPAAPLAPVAEEAGPPPAGDPPDGAP